jgi:cytoplasmic iron level regulating protein YaaA (DUF328/UPF0246 family)
MEKECISCVFGEPKAFNTLCTKVSRNFSDTDRCDYWKEKSQEQLSKDKKIREELYRIETARINAWQEQRTMEEEARRRAWQEQLRGAEKKEQAKIVVTENKKHYGEGLNRTTKNQSTVSSVSKKQANKQTPEEKYPYRLGKIQLYQDHFLWENTKHDCSEVASLFMDAVRHAVRIFPGSTCCYYEQVWAMITLNDGNKINVKASSFIGIGSYSVTEFYYSFNLL